MVRIELPPNDDYEAQGRQVDAVMRDMFGVNGSFEYPSLADENTYKLARYAWHHKCDPQEVAAHALRSLERREVFPGYTTMVEPGRHKRYKEQYGEFAVFHRLANLNNLSQVLTHGVLSTHERFCRGVQVAGISSLQDIECGGADNVFTSIVSQSSLEKDRTGYYATWEQSAILVFKPDVLDRTDWYTYWCDQYGSTDPAIFNERSTPNQLFQDLADKGYKAMESNEQMFRTGLPVEAIAGIATPIESHYQYIVYDLHQAGIHEVNGIPVEKFVHPTDHISQLIDLAHGRQTDGQK